MKKIYLILLLIFYPAVLVAADVKKFLGDPNPVDHVFDCINPEETFENVIQIGFNKIDPIKDIYDEKKDLVYQPGLGDGLGFTSFGPSISLAKLYNDQLYWSEYSVGINRDEGSYTIYTLNLNEMNLSSNKNKEIILNAYSWDVKGAPAPLLRKLFMDINDLINGDYAIFTKKVQEIDNALEVQLSPMSDFSKFKNKDPDLSWSYVCNLGKYIPEN